MPVEYVPLLQRYAELYAKPRDMQRFQDYIDTLSTPEHDDVAVLPLNMMNPMAKPHVLDAIHALIVHDTDGVAELELDRHQAELSLAIAQALPLPIGDRRTVAVPSMLKFGISVLDAAGGWTHRASSDFSLRSAVATGAERGWCVIPLWAQDTHSPETVQTQTRLALHRLMFVLAHGNPHSLSDWMLQEGMAHRQAGVQQWLDADDLAYSAEVLKTHAIASDTPTLISALYGDAAARELGYTPLGLSPNAGFAVALAQAG